MPKATKRSQDSTKNTNYQRKYASTATTRKPSIEQRTQAVKKKLPKWLYEACEEAFDEAYFECLAESGPDRALILEKVQELEVVARSFAPFYPSKPPASTTLPDSESVRNLRTVLSLLPERATWEAEGLGDRRSTDKTGSVYVHLDGASGIESTHLTDRRSKELRHSLKEIELKHGKEIRAIANWEVYEKVRSSPTLTSVVQAY